MIGWPRGIRIVSRICGRLGKPNRRWATLADSGRPGAAVLVMWRYGEMPRVTSFLALAWLVYLKTSREVAFRIGAVR